MSAGPTRARIDSIRQRLLDRARERGEEFQYVLDRFAVERLLYRLSVSPYRERFVLKGALLLGLWTGQQRRPTRDADFLSFGEPDNAALGRIVRELCGIAADDGLLYDVTSIRIEPIREESKYQGQRISLTATFGVARCRVQWDVGFGDVVTPGPVDNEYPMQLAEFAPALLCAYPRESVFAEKFDAICVLGMANSRMKDYFDLLQLIHEGALDRADLRRAILATLERRDTPFPSKPPIGLTDEFAEDSAKTAQWLTFLKRNKLAAPPLEAVAGEIRRFLEPLLEWPGSASASDIR